MGVAMGIKDQIFEEFFTKLAVEDEVPITVITELKSLAAGGESVSEEAHKTQNRCFSCSSTLEKN